MGSNADVHWKLETVESARSYKNFTVTGQFPLAETGIGWNVGNVIGEAGSQGHEHPFVQWIRGETQTVTVPVIFFSRHKNEDIEGRLKEVLRMTLRDRLLNRSPICRFTYGTALNQLCLVRSLGTIQIHRLRSDGKARRINFTITLVKYKPYKLSEVDPTKPFKDSRHHVVGEFEQSWEMLAVKEYGPDLVLYGDRLRKRNRANAFAAPVGSEAKIPNVNRITAEKITPEFHAFARGNEAAEGVVLAKFTARNALFKVKVRP